jgi:hypothetical protein
VRQDGATSTNKSWLPPFNAASAAQWRHSCSDIFRAVVNVYRSSCQWEAITTRFIAHQLTRLKIATIWCALLLEFSGWGVHEVNDWLTCCKLDVLRDVVIIVFPFAIILINVTRWQSLLYAKFCVCCEI